MRTRPSIIVVRMSDERALCTSVALGQCIEPAERAVAPADQVAGHVAEAPIAHRAGLGGAIWPDLGREITPELLIRLDARDLLGSCLHVARVDQRAARVPRCRVTRRLRRSRRQIQPTIGSWVKRRWPEGTRAGPTGSLFPPWLDE
jgi:hypothetical protein